MKRKHRDIFEIIDYANDKLYYTLKPKRLPEWAFLDTPDPFRF